MNDFDETAALAAQEEIALTSQGDAALTLEALGRSIVARVERGDKAKDRADQMYRSAGLQLIEAKSRAPNFSAFLRDHCNGLSRSRAYELIAIAEGKAEEVRSQNRERDRRRRAKAAGVREPRTHGAAMSDSEQALAKIKDVVDKCFPKMDYAAKQEAAAYVNDQLSHSLRSVH